MIGLDTNVLVRYITQDDREQADIATHWIEANCSLDSPGWINVIVLCETVWVLSRAYGYDKATVQSVLQRIFLACELTVENQEDAWSALRDYAQGNADFSDYLIACMNRSAACKYTVSFDRKASEHRLIQLLE
ncbi:MAG: type II toxin-antitoxin system VapC family toxin [Mariprofundaceae bacterium]|nr:type II toxin-antitoxin system VapC family toxin [Mariprofundaceae bacterium]